MSRYDFTPIQHPAGTANQNYCFWENGFTETQLKAIENYGDGLALKAASINAEAKSAPGKFRKTQVGWLAYNDQTREFYDTLAGIVQRLNASYYRFDLTGFIEDFQYGVYSGAKRDHYDWHIDAGPNTYSPRKLSISVQLTDPKKYEGGELQLMTSAGTHVTATKKLGTVIAFPSYALHRVSLVTKGVRKSIVAWVSGPPFK